MKLGVAEEVAWDVVKVLAPACEEIEIAGSIRRRKAEPKDVEIVYIPRLGRRQVGLWEYEEYSLASVVVDGMVEAGTLAWDEVVKRNGPKYKRLIDVGTGLVVELFAARRENWGYILALRTGPAGFNKLLVSKGWHGGAMPLDMKVYEGYLWHAGELVETPTEERFFEALGVPCWAPEERTVERLRDWLVGR
jgi:DNA polymerase/3'-5' exonuclease PolX